MNLRDYRKSESGGVIVWLFVICIFGAIAYYLNEHPELLRSNRPTPPVISKASPSATPAPEATPEPQSTPKPTPEPTATPSSTPTPTPADASTPTPPSKIPPDFAMIAKTAALWPRQVVLLKPASFPVVFNGKVAGQTQAPAGVAVRLLRVLPDISNPQVEVEFQNNRQTLPAAATDLAVRAMALRDATPHPATANPLTGGTAAMPMASSAPLATPAPTVAMLHGASSKFADRVTVDIVRQKESHLVDSYDDKSDTVSLKVRIVNTDMTATFSGLTARVYILAEDLLNRDKLKVIGIRTFTFSLPHSGEFERITEKATSGRYDEEQNASRYGFKYYGWFVRITDDAGSMLCEKANQPSILKCAGTITNTSEGSTFSRK